MSVLDDFSPIQCSIVSSLSTNGHTVILFFCGHPVFSFLQEYVLECRRYSGSKESERFWIINKRFNDFVALDSGLHQSGYQGSSLNLPKKKIVGNMGKMTAYHVNSTLFYLFQIEILSS